MSNYKDDFEQLFNKKLSTGTSPDGWNVPPDDLFENAFLQIESKKSSNKKPLFLLLGCALLFSAFYYVFKTQKIIQDSQNEINALKIALKNETPNVKDQFERPLFKTSKKENKTTIEQDNNKVTIDRKPRNKTASLNDESTIIESKNNSRKKNSHIQKDHLINTYRIAVASNRSTSDNSFVMNIANDKTQSKNTLVDSQNQKSNAINSYKTENILPIKKKASGIFHKKERMPLTLAILPNNKTENHEPQKQWGLRLLGSSNASSFKMTNLPPVGNQMLVGYDAFNSGLGFEIGLSYNLSKKQSIIISLGYDKIENHSLLASSHNYNSDNIYNNASNESQYRAYLDYDSPLGFSTQESDLEMKNLNLIEDENLFMAAMISQELDLVSLGFTYQFKLLQKSKFVLSANVQPSINYILKLKNATQISLLKANDLVMAAKESQSIDSYQSLFYTAEVGLELGYNYSNQVRFIVNSSYSHSINSLRKVQASDDPSTYLQLINVNLGTVLRF